MTKNFLLSWAIFLSSLAFIRFHKLSPNWTVNKTNFLNERRRSKSDTSGEEFIIKDAGLIIRLPNNRWHRTPTPDGNPIQYFFKREQIKNSKGVNVIPAILVWFDIANKDKYHGNLAIYREQKITNMMNAGLEIEQTLRPVDRGYPLTFKKGTFHKASYTRDGVEHIMYLMYFINKNNIGFQVSMDMTKDIAPQYESEFWTTIRSLKDL